MKERPILMTPENAQKCFDGVKTQTRRLIKPQPEEGMNILGPEIYTPCRTDKNGEMYPGEDVFGVYSDDGEWGVACPYGVVGDRLWVREPTHLGARVFYRGADDVDGTVRIKWTPSIHMPRWACRTVVEITEIRVQRVQEISRGDAKAEGLWPGANGLEQAAGRSWGNAQLAFRALWDSINGPESWEQNPWVWALSFKKVPA